MSGLISPDTEDPRVVYHEHMLAKSMRGVMSVNQSADSTPSRLCMSIPG